MNLLMSLWLITTGALRKRPGMTLMFTGNLKMVLTWQRFHVAGTTPCLKSLTVHNHLTNNELPCYKIHNSQL